VQRLRKSYCNRQDSIPTEITLAGSSGVIKAIPDILKDIQSFQARFSGWSVFPNTTIAYLQPQCRKIFDTLHTRIKESIIPLSNSDFPYDPHCTIVSEWSDQDFKAINSIPFPEYSFYITSISLLELNMQTQECKELAKFKL